MCYQTRLIRKREEIMERFNAAIDELSDFEPFELCNAFDFPKTPVITNEKPQKIQLFNWGLVPFWSQDKDIRKFTLNARIETLHEKKSFKDVIQNRCIVIADGFYEWQWLTKNGSKKEKYLITLPNEALFAFAGIYSQWIDFDDSKFNSYTIITTQANEIMSKIHNSKQRMPVILKKKDEQLWLQGEKYMSFATPYTVNHIPIKLNENNSQLGLFDSSLF